VVTAGIRPGRTWRLSGGRQRRGAALTGYNSHVSGLGFLVSRRLRKLIGPEHMKRGETILDYMPQVRMLDEHLEPARHPLGGPWGSGWFVTLIATDEALYVLDDLFNRRSGGRLPWRNITTAHSRGDILVVRYVDGDMNALQATGPAHSWGLFAEFVKACVEGADRDEPLGFPTTW